MDTTSHGLWSFVIWHGLPFPFLAILFGILPDVIAISPIVFYHVLHGNRKKALLSEDEGAPAKLRHYKNVAFNYTHSLVIAGAVTAVVWLVWGIQWWILAWPLHIAVDIFSHPREKATPFLWPLMGTRVHGMKWWSKQFLVINAGLLIAAYIHYVR